MIIKVTLTMKKNRKYGNLFLKLNSGIKQPYYCKTKRKWWACGPATLYYSLSSLGIVTTPEEVLTIISQFKTGDEKLTKGISTDLIRKVFLRFGIKISVENIKCQKLLYFILRNASYSFPVIVSPPGHVVSVFKAAKSFIYYIEPDETHKITSCSSLSSFAKYCFGGREFVEVIVLTSCFEI